MFLMPVAVFVILYSVPRFFELETKYEPRSLCSTTTIMTTTSMASFMNATLLDGDVGTSVDAIFASNDSVVSSNNDIVTSTSSNDDDVVTDDVVSTSTVSTVTHLSTSGTNAIKPFFAVYDGLAKFRCGGERE